jgi:hypothetical protein
MRYLRQFCAATMLVCVLAFSAYAGDIECDGHALSPQPTVAGDIQYGITDALLLMLALV